MGLCAALAQERLEQYPGAGGRGTQRDGALEQVADGAEGGSDPLNVADRTAILHAATLRQSD